MTLLFYTLVFMVIGLTLFAIARKPVLLQAMHPALNDMVIRLTSRRAKHVYWGFFYLFRALSNLALLFIGGMLAFFAVRSGEEETKIHDGSFWKRDVCGVWYSHDADDDSSSPPLY